MKNLSFSIVVIAIYLTACSENTRVSEQNPLVEFADSLFDSSVDSSFIAGASVNVYHKGKMLLDNSYGFANLELSVPMPEEASFEIGSVTKQFTSEAGQVISIDIEAQPESLIVSTEGRSQSDTLDIYLGKNTWSQGTA